MSKFSVYQHWDPLRVCIVGKSYPPEYYSWITIPHVQELFERIAIETEEDYQNIINKLTSFGVEVLRPELPKKIKIADKYLPPPMTPRDYMVMIGETFYLGYQINLLNFYDSVKDASWPDIMDKEQFWNLPSNILKECKDIHLLDDYLDFYSSYDRIFARIAAQGNLLKDPLGDFSNGAYVSRIGRDLYFGTSSYSQEIDIYKKTLDQEFPKHRTHIINTGGHSDGTYCPVCPGLIISLQDVPSYQKTFPGWEVVYLPNQSWGQIKSFLQLKRKNQGKWWIPGFEHDQDVLHFVETWLNDWVGFVEETVFDVNMLVINPTNVIVFNYNEKVFKALEKYGITPHVVPFRHRYFWDGGIHCVTTDLHREGTMQDYFPGRDNEG